MRVKGLEFRVLLLPVLVLGVIACFALAWAKPAQAVTKQFDYLGEIEQWTVPPSVSSIQMTVAGARGGDSSTHPARGRGGMVTTITPVLPGQEFAVAVGQFVGVGVVAFGGGAHGARSGGGGSFVFRSLDGGNTWSPFVVAGGGGGNHFAVFLKGGDGGFADGTPNGQDGVGTTQSFGLGATTSAPGGGPIPGSPIPASYVGGVFVPGEGGDAHTEDEWRSSGGGGGGGYYGGGTGISDTDVDETLDGAGGGGSGYLHPGLAVEDFGTNDDMGFVQFEYSQGAVLNTAVKPAKKSIKAGKAQAFTVKIRNRGGAVAENVKVCIKLPKGKKAKLIGKKCRTKKMVVASSTWTSKFRVRKTAKGKKAKLTLKVTGAGLPSSTTTAVLRRK